MKGKYYANYADYNNNKWLLLIADIDDYISDAVEINLVDVPIIDIEDSRNFYEGGIRASGLKFSINGTKDNSFMDLFDKELFKIMVSLYKNDKLFWTGILNNDVYECDFNEYDNYPISFTASDFKVFENSTSIMKNYNVSTNNLKSIIEIINFDLLVKYYKNIKVNQYTSFIFDNIGGNTSTNLFTHSYVLKSNFINEDDERRNDYEIVDEILKGINHIMYQFNGEFYLIDVFSYKYSYYNNSFLIGSNTLTNTLNNTGNISTIGTLMEDINTYGIQNFSGIKKCNDLNIIFNPYDMKNLGEVEIKSIIDTSTLLANVEYIGMSSSSLQFKAEYYSKVNNTYENMCYSNNSLNLIDYSYGCLPCRVNISNNSIPNYEYYLAASGGFTPTSSSFNLKEPLKYDKPMFKLQTSIINIPLNATKTQDWIIKLNIDSTIIVNQGVKTSPGGASHFDISDYEGNVTIRYNGLSTRPTISRKYYLWNSGHSKFTGLTSCKVPFKNALYNEHDNDINQEGLDIPIYFNESSQIGGSFEIEIYTPSEYSGTDVQQGYNPNFIFFGINKFEAKIGYYDQYGKFIDMTGSDDLKYSTDIDTDFKLNKSSIKTQVGTNFGDNISQQGSLYYSPTGLIKDLLFVKEGNIYLNNVAYSPDNLYLEKLRLNYMNDILSVNRRDLNITSDYLDNIFGIIYCKYIDNKKFIINGLTYDTLYDTMNLKLIEI